MPFVNIGGREIHFTDTPVLSPSTSNDTTSSDGTSSAASSKQPTLDIIFVHGLGSTQNFFHPILPHLSQYRCVTFDNYAAGRSKYYADLYPDTSIGGIAADVIALMNYLEIKRAVVVGYSMGGMVPTTLAASSRWKDRIIAGICLGPVHPTEEGVQTFKGRIKSVQDINWALTTFVLAGMQLLADTIPLAATAESSTALSRAFIREMLLAQPPDGYIANCRAIVAAVSSPPRYEDVTVPILIVAGEEDKSAPLSGCEYIYDRLGTQRKDLVTLQKVGHWFGPEAPDVVGGVINMWLQKLRSA